MVLPQINGWDVLAALKADPKVSQIPIVMTTVDEEQRRAEKMGAADFLAKPPRSEDVVKTVDALVPGNPGARRKRVALVVDDDPDDRYVMRTTLKPTIGRLSRRKTDAMDRQTSPLKPDIIITDLVMPVMDGSQLVREIRREKLGKSIPVVVMTGCDLTRDEREDLEKWVTFLIEKGPNSRRVLLREIEDIVTPDDGGDVDREVV